MAQPTITQSSLNAMTQGSAFSQTLTATASPPDTETLTVRHDSTDGGFDTQELDLTVEEEPAASGADYTFDWSEVLGESYINGSGVFTSDPSGATVPNSSGATIDLRTFSTPVGDVSIGSATGQDFSHYLRGDWSGPPYPGGGGDQQIGVVIAFPVAVRADEWWVELPVRYSTGWRVDSGHKTIFITSSTGNRWEMRLGDPGVLNAQMKMNNTAISTAQDGGSARDISGLLWDGAAGDSWHVLRMHLRTGPDGIFEWMLDGVEYDSRRLDAADATVSTALDDFVSIETCGNGDPSSDGTIDWGNHLIYLTDPGWF